MAPKCMVITCRIQAAVSLAVLPYDDRSGATASPIPMTGASTFANSEIRLVT